MLFAQLYYITIKKHFGKQNCTIFPFFLKNSADFAGDYLYIMLRNYVR